MEESRDDTKHIYGNAEIGSIWKAKEWTFIYSISQ